MDILLEDIEVEEAVIENTRYCLLGILCNLRISGAGSGELFLEHVPLIELTNYLAKQLEHGTLNPVHFVSMEGDCPGQLKIDRTDTQEWRLFNPIDAGAGELMVSDIAEFIEKLSMKAKEVSKSVWSLSLNFPMVFEDV